jgi:RNA polymerase sigma factor (sigma-70 family)
MSQVAPSRLLSDTTIAQRAAGGDQRAFAAIFERYHQDLYRYCVAILGNAEEARDAVQNTMLKILRALPGETRELKLKSWLYRIAHNEAIDMIRARRDTDPIEAETLGAGGGPADQLEARSRLRELVSDIAELPDRQRGALVMREMGGLSYEQIGEALQTSSAVARQTIYEARLGLRQMSEGREMPCQEVMQAISDDDGRVLRRRDIRSHLRRCESCRAFRSEIAVRRQEFAALAPLPAAISAGVLQSLLGGGGAAAGGTGAAGAAGGAAAGKALAGSAAIKSAAAILAVSAVGIVAADRSGVVDLGVRGDQQPPAKVTPDPTRPSARNAADAPRTGRVTKASESAESQRRQGVTRLHQAAGVATSPGSPTAPGSTEASTDENPGSNGRHLGWTKGGGRGENAAKPTHPAKGKKDSSANPSGQPKGSGQSKHSSAEKGGGKAAAEATHPAHPEHPPHPTKPEAAATPDAETGPAASTEAGAAEHGSPAR